MRNVAQLHKKRVTIQILPAWTVIITENHVLSKGNTYTLSVDFEYQYTDYTP